MIGGTMWHSSSGHRNRCARAYAQRWPRFVAQPKAAGAATSAASPNRDNADACLLAELAIPIPRHELLGITHARPTCGYHCSLPTLPQHSCNSRPHSTKPPVQPPTTTSTKSSTCAATTTMAASMPTATLIAWNAATHWLSATRGS